MCGDIPRQVDSHKGSKRRCCGHESLPHCTLKMDSFSSPVPLRLQRADFIDRPVDGGSLPVPMKNGALLADRTLVGAPSRSSSL